MGTRECKRCGSVFSSARCTVCQLVRDASRREWKRSYNKLYRLSGKGAEAFRRNSSTHEAKRKRAAYAQRPDRKADALERSRRPENKRRSFELYLARRYGISVEDYARMFERQNGRCDICDAKLEIGSYSTELDHCHELNNVRSLLCRSCNTRLPGSLDELLLFMNYMLKHRNPPEAI